MAKCPKCHKHRLRTVDSVRKCIGCGYVKMPKVSEFVESEVAEIKAIAETEKSQVVENQQVVTTQKPTPVSDVKVMPEKQGFLAMLKKRLKR